ncbi:putative RNA-directed DNA polymerase, eukaryota, reverse transcriptase zinc-binding domain protein [Tanacetum coccineum]
MICPSTYQLLRSSGGDSGPDMYFNKSASPKRLFSLARVSLAGVSKLNFSSGSSKVFDDSPLILCEIVEWFKKEEKVVNFQVNGIPTSEFSIKRGLRQRDTLSHFLFILVMEGLHNALCIGVSLGLIRGVKFGSPEVTISHLFYADDVIITTEWNANDLDNIIRVLQVSYLDSGLKINIQKSNVYGIGVSDVDVSSMASNSRCASRSFPFTYLGLTVGCSMSLTSSGQVLLDWFQSKLSSWKANILSIGGRHTIINILLMDFFDLWKVGSTLDAVVEGLMMSKQNEGSIYNIRTYYGITLVYGYAAIMLIWASFL